MARRFVCPPDVAWRLFHDGVCAVGALLALLALLLQWLPGMLAWLVTAMPGVVAVMLVGRRVRGFRPPTGLGDEQADAVDAAGHAETDGADLLRWDTQQWWWQPAGHRPDGAPLAITPVVLLDLEHWMLLRLRLTDHVGDGDGERESGSRVARYFRCRLRFPRLPRFWQHRLVAVSRRHHGGDWSLLRIHLFMARE